MAKARAVVSRSVERLLRDANASMEREAYGEAILRYRRVLSADPACEEAVFNLAAALAETGDYAASEAACRRFIERQPDPAAAHRGVAEALARHRIERYTPGLLLPETETLDAALAEYRRVILALPALRAAWSNLGETLMRAGRLADAEAALAQATLYSEELAEAFRNVGATIMHPGDLEAALALHRRAMALAPDHEHMTEQDYFATPLTFTENEILLPDGFEVMMEWERPIMERSAEIVCHNHGDVLNVGFGMAIIDTAIQGFGAASHTIIEAHPEVVRKAQAWAADKPNVRILASRWQDVLEDLPPFDGIYFDTLMPPMVPFLEHVPRILKPGGVFLYFQATIYLENLEAMIGRGLRLGLELHPFEHIPENRYYRLNERTPDGRYTAPLFIYQQSP